MVNATVNMETKSTKPTKAKAPTNTKTKIKTYKTAKTT